MKCPKYPARIEEVKTGQQHDSARLPLDKCLGIPRNWGASILEHWNISETAALEILRQTWAMGFKHRCMTLAITERIERTIYCRFLVGKRIQLDAH